MEKIDIKVNKLVPWAKLPEYETKKAAGCDISIALLEEVVLYPNEVRALPTGFSISIPDGYEAQIRSRAGMTKKGIIVANAPGTLNCEHVGEVKVLLLNVTEKPVRILPGQKVAQMIFGPILQAKFIED
jgi:dUTP pyrophosphatase